MSLFAVTREAGPSWTEGKGAFEQPAVNDHAAFMNSLADEGFVLFAGPLAGTEHDRIRVLLIAEAASETDIHRRLADDPMGTHTTSPHHERRAVESFRRNSARRRTASRSVNWTCAHIANPLRFGTSLAINLRAELRMATLR